MMKFAPSIALVLATLGMAGGASASNYLVNYQCTFDEPATPETRSLDRPFTVNVLREVETDQFFIRYTIFPQPVEQIEEGTLTTFVETLKPGVRVLTIQRDGKGLIMRVGRSPRTGEPHFEIYRGFCES